jgi:dihydrolipoamide dehydrogenase
MEKYDVVVIGGGPGGYVAAIRCAQLGLKTAVVESWRNEAGDPALGGTCLNVGCIPSKALLDSSHHYHAIQHDLADHGISASGVNIDIKKMMARKQKVVQTLTGGVASLFLKHKITWLKGHGAFVDTHTIKVTGHDGGEQSVSADKVIIATGSRPRDMEFAPVDNKHVLDSTGALALTSVPKHLVVIGGGVIGLELGSVWKRLGARVTVLIRGQQFLRAVDQQIAREAQRILEAQGLDIQLEARPLTTKVAKSKVTVTYEQAGEEKRLSADKVLVSVGRVPHTEGLNLDAVDVSMDDKGFIEVDDHCRTAADNIFAIGDVVRGPMLAHKASEEGVAVAEIIAGQSGHVNYQTIPWVIYTFPEIAWVGATTQELQQQGRKHHVGVFPLKANGRAHAMGHTDGLVKILSDAETDQILGVHILGPAASELIAEAVTAMEFSASAEDLARTVHAHPTLSEAVHEAALAVDKRTIHI